MVQYRSCGIWKLKNKRLFYQRNLKMICFFFSGFQREDSMFMRKNIIILVKKCRNRSRAPDRETEPFLRPVSKLQGIQNQDNIRKHLSCNCIYERNIVWIRVFKENSILIKHGNCERKCVAFCFLGYFVIKIKFQILYIIFIRIKFSSFSNLKIQFSIFFSIIDRTHETGMCTNVIIHKVGIFVYYSIVHRQGTAIQMIWQVKFEIIRIMF